MADKKRILEGKWGVVTGASSGIGLQFCHRLAELGCNLVMVAIEDELLVTEAMAVASAHGVTARSLTLDLTRREAPSLLLGFLDSKKIEPYILINNAGIFAFTNVVEMDERHIDRFVDLHVRSVTMLSRLFAERMAEAGSGHILNMSSMSCWMPMPGIAMYSATKAYLRVFSRALHYEMRDSGVRVMVACPGGIATDLFGLPDNLMRLAVRLGVIQRPEVFVRKTVARMLRGRQQYINGIVNRLVIIAVGMTPTWLRMQVKRRMLDRKIRMR